MAHRFRMFNERCYAPERLSEDKNAQAFNQTERGFTASTDVKREHSTEPGHLCASQRVLRM